MRGYAKHFTSFRKELNKFNNTGAQMLDSIFGIYILPKGVFALHLFSR